MGKEASKQASGKERATEMKKIEGEKRYVMVV